MNRRILLPIIAALGAGLPSLQAQETYENAPAFRAADLLSPTILESSRYTIDATVPTDGLLGIFQLRTNFGDFECRGLEMLHTRLHELGAIEQIGELNKSEVFLDAAKAAALKPVKSVAKIVSDPVESVKEIPKGVGRLFGKVVKGVGNAGKEVSETVKNADEGGPKTPSKREDPFGYNDARNQWARQFNVDPYTSNEVLTRKLNELARITFSTTTAAGFGIGAVAAPLNMVSTVDSLVLTQSPATVRAQNAQTLAAMGLGTQEAALLLDNRWFTPTLQTRFVRAFAPLGDVHNARAAVALAANVQSEDEARFLCRGIEVLDRYHTGVAPLAELTPFGRIPAAVGRDGTLVVSAPVDVIAWTKVVADFVSQQDHPEVKPVLCTTGRLTQRATDEFKARGWQVHQRFLDVVQGR